MPYSNYIYKIVVIINGVDDTIGSNSNSLRADRAKTTLYSDIQLSLAP
jgi:hypothetical protein